MNRDRFEERDFLSKYINPQGREAAPEGFTERVMNRVERENALNTSKGVFRPGIAVPSLTIIVTISLISAAIILLPRTDISLFPEFFRSLDSLQISLPELNTDWLNSFSVPAIVLYIAGGFLALSLLDRLLHRVFHS